MPIFPSGYDQNTSPATTDKILVADVSNSNKTEWSEIGNLPVSTATQSAIDNSILSSTLVHTTGNETIADIKTFSSSPIVPTPTSSTQVATKGYADGLALTAGTGNVVGAASSIDGDIVGFDSTTGKVIKATGLNQPSSITNTSVSSQGGLLINIDSATGDIARTTDGWNEDEKHGVYVASVVAGWSSQFNSSVTRTGRLTYKLSTTNTSGRVIGNSYGVYSVGNYGIQKTLFPIKPSTKYKFGCWLKTNNVATNGAFFNFVEFTSGIVAGTVSPTNRLTGTNDWTFCTVTVTTGASSVYLGVQYKLDVAGNISDAWFDINSMTLEEVVEPVANSLTLATPSIQSFTAVGSTDNIDQSMLTTSGTAVFGNATRNFHYQQFLPRKSKLTGVMVQRNFNSGTFVGDVIVKVRNDSANDPGSTVLASYTIPNATWNGLTGSTDYFVPLPCNLTVDGSTKYWVQLGASTSDAVNYTNINVNSTNIYTDGLCKYSSAELSGFVTYSGDLYFKTLYYKPTTNFKASQNNTSISISADEDGFLDGSVTSLVNGTYSFTKTYAGNETEIAKNYYYSYNVTGQGLLEGVSAGIPINSAFGVNNLVYKVSTILPISNINLILTPQCQPAPRSFKVQYSTDNISYTDLRTYTNADNLAAQTTAIPISGVTVFYLKFVFVASGICYINSLSLSGTLDTSTIPTLYNYPTNKAIRETYTKTLSANTTTAIYRATKYGFPAIEYSNGEYQFLNIDTTATSSVVKFSELGVTYTTVADGGSIALTSTNKPVVYVEVNITANRIYLSSNDYNAISDKDGSNKQTVVYQVKFQGLVDAYNDLKDKLNKIVSYLATL